jgi:aerobic-type carbon monoxide dehydrogenase small subunit (CoxS/CutS family)
MAERFVLRVNGEERAVTVEPDTPLLYALRNDLELNGPKFGCGLLCYPRFRSGQCRNRHQRRP